MAKKKKDNNKMILFFIILAVIIYTQQQGIGQTTPSGSSCGSDGCVGGGLQAVTSSPGVFPITTECRYGNVLVQGNFPFLNSMGGTGSGTGWFNEGDTYSWDCYKDGIAVWNYGADSLNCDKNGCDGFFGDTITFGASFQEGNDLNVGCWAANGDDWCSDSLWWNKQIRIKCFDFDVWGDPYKQLYTPFCQDGNQMDYLIDQFCQQITIVDDHCGTRGCSNNVCNDCDTGQCCDTSINTFNQQGTQCTTTSCPADTACRIYSTTDSFCTGDSQDCPAKNCAFQDMPPGTPCTGGDVCDGAGNCGSSPDDRVLVRECHQNPKKATTCENSDISFDTYNNWQSAAANDGDFNTGSRSIDGTTAELVANYDWPIWATKAIWAARKGVGINFGFDQFEISTTGTCSRNPLKIKVSSIHDTSSTTPHQLTYDCWTGSIWSRLFESKGTTENYRDFYDTGITWQQWEGGLDCTSLSLVALARISTWANNPSTTNRNNALQGITQWASNC